MQFTCKNHMQFTYYVIINIMYNAHVCNTILIGRYIQTNVIQYQTDLYVYNVRSLQEVSFWHCEHHGSGLLFC